MNLKPSERAPGASRHSARFATGRVLAGRYELLDQLGEGGTAEVFRARDHRLDREVAVKVLRPEFGQDDRARARFAVEARSAATLNVSNIVPIFDFGAADDGSLFIVMRLIHGPSLRRILAEVHRLPTAAAVDVGRQIAEALAEAHTHGLVHRDVKPGNILVDPEGIAHLTDFGTVKALAGADDLTKSGTIFGTAAYLSPEQATGGSIGAYTDIYALGVVLYEALSGEPPFRGDDPVAVSYRHAHELPRPLASLVPGIDREINDLVMTCLAKAPDQRPADAARLASMLDIVGRRLAPRGGGTHVLAQLAASIDAGTSVSAGERARVEPDKETVALPQGAVPPAAAVAPAAAVPPPIVSPSVVPASAARPAPVPSWDRPVIERGVVPSRGIHRETQPKRRGGALGPALLVAVLLVLIGVSVFTFTSLLRPADEDPGFAAAPTPTNTPAATARRPRRTDLAVVITVPPVPTVIVTQVPFPSPPPATEPPAPTPAPTPVATRAPTPVPPRPPSDVTRRIPDSRFVGDFPGDGTYHGRSASWIYGQGTAYSTMTATFTLDSAATPQGTARLELVGLDGENPVRNTMRVVLNGATLYEGPNPLPDDFCCGGSGPGNWGSAVFEFPQELLASQNTLSITNLEPSDCTSCPRFVMLDYASLSYRTPGQ